MQISTLDAKHPTYDADTWREYDALYRGGKTFRRCIATFLRQNPEEPADVYAARQHEARYISYCGPIVDFFAGKLLASPPVVRARNAETGDEIEPDAFYADWKEDVDRAGTDLVDFVRERFVAASTKGRSWWRVERPNDDGIAPLNLAEWESRGLGRVRLCAIENEQVLDWEVDETGHLLWAIVYSVETRRADPRTTRSRIREVWELFDREAVETFEAVYDPSAGEQRPETATSLGRRAHGFSSVPLVMLGFVGTRGVRVKMSQPGAFGLVTSRYVNISAGALEGFWLMNRLADAQIAHFRMSAALDWNFKRTCYAMPVFSMDGEMPIMGTGYGLRIGKDDKASWLAPPTAHLASMIERTASIKDEIYRVANQLAQGVDNNAAAIGRSAESKASDAAATEVVLKVYGALCREAIERTYELVSEGRGDTAIRWHIEGLDSFNAVDAAALVQTATEAAALNIPSATFNRELLARVADAMLPTLDQSTKDAIRQEIADGIAAEQTMRDVMADKAPPPPGDDEPDGDESGNAPSDGDGDEPAEAA